MSLKNLQNKISSNSYTITFPINKTTTKFKPYTVGDEKILLAAAAARESDPQFYIDNTLEVIRKCISDDTNLLDSLASADVEYLLLKIRSKSVGENITIQYKHPKEKEAVQIDLDLDKFTVEVDPKHEYTIKLSEEVGMQMKDITFVDKISYGSKFNDANKTDAIYQTIVDCVDKIYDGEDVYVVGHNITKAEVSEFIYSLTGISTQLYQFIATMPQLSITFEHPKTKEVVTLRGNEIDFLALSPATLT